jgi:hypothetical protein
VSRLNQSGKNQSTHKSKKMSGAKIPEFVMALLHSSIVHQVASVTFQQQSNHNNTTSNIHVVDNDANKSPVANSSNNNNNKLSPLICSSADKATEFYHRLETLGFTIGLRVAERLLCASGGVGSALGGANSNNNNSSERPQDEAINLVRTVLWPALFGKEIVRESDPAAQHPSKTADGSVNLTYKLLDADFSWTRSVALPPDSASLADPFIRGSHHDILEDAAAFAAGVSKSAKKQQQQQQQQQNGADPVTESLAQQKKLSTGPNDYVVLLTGLILGFLSSLGFGSHAERRVFGGDRCSISAQTSAMTQQGGGSGSISATPTNNNNNNMSSNSSAIIARPPTSFVTVRHRLVSREGEPVRPSGMQLKLVLHFA